MANKISFYFCKECYQPDKKKLRKLVKAVLNEHNINNSIVDILVGDDKLVEQKNSEHLNHHYTTDVISFDLSDDFSDENIFTIIVNAQMAQRQAVKRGHCADSELALYICHGLLHNLGYNDDNKANAKKMHCAEDEILKSVGFGIVYNS